MEWLWPDVLLFLGCIPLLIILYIVLRHRRHLGVRYSSLTLVDTGLRRSSWLRLHFPFVLSLLAFTSLVIATARPVVPEAVLSGRTTIILTLDISRSMCMQDITPNRFDVARAAALSFIHQPVLGTQIGVVAFAGFAELAQEPTNDVKLLENTITTLTTATQTAIGSAILRSLDAIAAVDNKIPASEEIDLPSNSYLTPQFQPHPRRADYVPHIIVLLTDGASNTGPPPLLAAQQAADRGVRIYSIGFGTQNAAIMDCWRYFPDDPSSGPAFKPTEEGSSSGNGPDEATLKQIAELTGGKFYTATSAPELHDVFQELHGYVAESNRTVEVSVFFAAAGAILAMAAFLLAVFWHPLL